MNIKAYYEKELISFDIMQKFIHKFDIMIWYHIVFYFSAFIYILDIG